MNHLETYGSMTQVSQKLRRLLQQFFSLHPMVRLIDQTADFSASVIQDVAKTCPVTYQFFNHSKRGFIMVSSCLIHWLVEELLGTTLESRQSTLHGFLTQLLIEDVFYAIPNAKDFELIEPASIWVHPEFDDFFHMEIITSRANDTVLPTSLFIPRSDS